MKTLCFGPIHKEKVTLPFAWVLRDSGKDGPGCYVVHRKVWNGPASVSYCDGHYFRSYFDALLQWLGKVKDSLYYQPIKMPFDPTDKDNWPEETP
jgi:hypothetical protein